MSFIPATSAISSFRGRLIRLIFDRNRYVDMGYKIIPYQLSSAILDFMYKFKSKRVPQQINMTFGKQLLNQVDRCVEDLIDGILLTNPHLSKIDGYNAVVRSDIDIVKQREVTLISGGGSGHEPSHAGYVGNGMLSAAVLGNVFASPSVASILATIRVVAGSKGVILIVKNYTGDRLNFGMALELAKQEGIQGKMVIVDDDCALPEGKGITGGRGIAGTVFIHKIAGACASCGFSLDEIYSTAVRTVQSTRTLGVALSTCTVPGTIPSTRLQSPYAIEIGMGIHGEPGREQANLPLAHASSYIAKILVDGVLARNSISVSSGDKVVALINNLGTLPILELNVVAGDIIKSFIGYEIYPSQIYVGSFMTSLDMNGISLSLLKISATDHHLLDYLNAPTSAPSWIRSQSYQVDDFLLHKRAVKASYPDTQKVQAKSSLQSNKLPVLLCERISQRIINIESLLSEYDSICGDGDCGIVMKKGATKLMEEMAVYREVEIIDPAGFFDHVANAISHSMGGTSGVLLELAFRSMTNYFQLQEVDCERMVKMEEWIESLECGVNAIKYYGGGDVGMRTMLDVLIPAVHGLKEGGIKEALRSAEKGMEATKTMASLAGRANYVTQERMQGTPDPGAYAMYCAIAEVCQHLGTDTDI